MHDRRLSAVVGLLCVIVEGEIMSDSFLSVNDMDGYNI